MTDLITLNLPAPSYAIYGARSAESLIGQEFYLDERIAGMVPGLIVQSLSADHRGLWTRARIVNAKVTDGGDAIRVEVELVTPTEGGDDA